MQDLLHLSGLDLMGWINGLLGISLSVGLGPKFYSGGLGPCEMGLWRIERALRKRGFMGQLKLIEWGGGSERIAERGPGDWPENNQGEADKKLEIFDKIE